MFSSSRGHLRAGSFCAAVARRYADAAHKAGHDVRLVALPELPIDFDPPDATATPPPAWVGDVQAALSVCEIWVIGAPMWWGGLPAALEALFERTSLEGFAIAGRTAAPGGTGSSPAARRGSSRPRTPRPGICGSSGEDHRSCGAAPSDARLLRLRTRPFHAARSDPHLDARAACIVARRRRRSRAARRVTRRPRPLSAGSG